VLCLEGDLGAGKTTFTKYLGFGMGITDTINSPTFTILKVYENKIPLYHMDVYRLNGIGAYYDLEEFVYGYGVCVIEWYRHIYNSLPDEIMIIEIEILGEELVYMKKSLRRLVIDTATKYLYIGLFQDESCLSSYYQAGENDHSEKLMSEIEVIFAKHQLKIRDVDEIIIGVGPGSYTGLRIGVVVAKMFAWNNDIPVKTISSLALIASSYNGSKNILAEVDARRGNSFLGLYRNTGEGLDLLDIEQLVNLEEYKQSLKDPYIVVSSGMPNIPKILASNLLVNVKDIHALNPNYLRITEAERNLG